MQKLQIKTQLQYNAASRSVIAFVNIETIVVNIG